MRGSMKDLPRELIAEILLRLPVKSLLRFRSVRKTWLSLISEPQFAKSHFDLAAAQTERIFFLTVNEVQYVDFEKSLHDDSALVKLNFPHFPSFPYVRIMGSCRGFLLLGDCSSNFFVYNPSTGVCRRISHSPMSSKTDNNLVFYVIGYDASKDDYLIVLGSHYFDPNWESITNQFEIFSLKANSWRTIEGTDFPYSDDPNQPRVGVLLNGALHWLAVRHDILEDIILAFDLIEEKSRDFPMPPGFHGSLYYQDLAVLEGCLSLCAKDGNTTCIWIMKEYGVRSSWIKSVVLSLAATTHNYISPICSTNSGEIVGQDGNLELVKLNYSGDLLEHRSYHNIPHWCRAAVYTESLLSLPGGSEEGGKDLQQS